MVPKPSWLRFKKWRSKGAPQADSAPNELVASCSEPELEPRGKPIRRHHQDDDDDDKTQLRLISEQPKQQLNPASRLNIAKDDEELKGADDERHHQRGSTKGDRKQANNNGSELAPASERGRSRHHHTNRRRLYELVPRALSNLIERAVSPNLRRRPPPTEPAGASSSSTSASGRPKSPLRKFHKHFKQKQETQQTSRQADKKQTQTTTTSNLEGGRGAVGELRAPVATESEPNSKRVEKEAANRSSGASVRANSNSGKDNSQQRPSELIVQLAASQPSERPPADRTEAGQKLELANSRSQMESGGGGGQEEGGDSASNERSWLDCDSPAGLGAGQTLIRERGQGPAAGSEPEPSSANNRSGGAPATTAPTLAPNSADRDESHCVSSSPSSAASSSARANNLNAPPPPPPTADKAELLKVAKSPVCRLTARTRDNQCTLHGSNIALCRRLSATSGGSVELAGAGNEPAQHFEPEAHREQQHQQQKRPATNESGQQKSGAPEAGATKRHRRRTPREVARSVSTWPLAKQTLDNNLPNEFRLGHFGDCEDLLSAHLAGRLFGALTAHDLIIHQKQHWQDHWQASAAASESISTKQRRLIANDNHHHHHRRRHLALANECQSQPAAAAAAFDQLVFQATSDALKLADQLRAFNYNHKRPFAIPFESPPTGWLFNATGLQPINSASARALRAKLFAANKFRRRSYDDQEGDNDINIILQPSDIDDIEKRARLGYARFKATTAGEANRNLASATTTTTTTKLTPATTTTTKESITDDDQDNGRPNQTNHPQHHRRSQAYKLRAFEGIFEDIKLAKCLLDQDYNQTVRLFIERSALNWNFNSFTFDALCCGRSLTELLLHLFDYYNLYAIFNLDIIKVLKCFRLLEFGYHSTNPYHNSVHAADVTQAMHCFIQENKIRSHMTDLEILCSILAAVCHDLDHPGVNQSFLVATNNPLASLYHNDSVLENHHWRFALCIFKESKLFDHFDQLVLADMKQQLKQLILATDIARQNDYLKRFKAMTSSNNFSMSNTEDRALVLQMALKCADLGNPCRPWLISRVWSNLICDEFYRMGQIERRLGVPLTPICQRNKTSIAGIQTEFFRFIVLPLLELWHNFLSSPLSNLLMSNFDHNYQRWQRANRIVQQLRRRKSVASLEPVPDLDDANDYASSSDCPDQRTKLSTSPLAHGADGEQIPFSSLIQSPVIDKQQLDGARFRRDSFELIKRASSDYIKSGNGRLESLRDFQLNRIIEKSPIISRLVIKPLN